MRLRHILLPLVITGCNEGTIWDPDRNVEITPDEAPVDHGQWMSLDLSPEGERIAMSYYDRANGALGFAVGTPQDDGSVSWRHERVDGYTPAGQLDPGDYGQYSSMKVAPDGTVWVAYYDATLRRLRWGHRLGGGPATDFTATGENQAVNPEKRYSWILGEVDVAPGAGEWSSLALDESGNPVIAYHDATNGTLKIARPVDASITDPAQMQWNIQEVVGAPFNGTDAEGGAIFRPADLGEFARLEIVGGTEMVACYDRAQQRLAFVEATAGNFANASVSYVSPEGVNMGQWPSILVDGQTVWVAYHDVENQDLVVASRTQSGWVGEVADAGAFVGADTEIVKIGGNLAVVYFDGQNNDMKFATKQGAVWVTETLGGDGLPVGFHNEIIRVGDDWWAASYDFTNRSVFTAKVGGTAQ